MQYEGNYNIHSIIQSFHRNLLIEGLPRYRRRLKYEERRNKTCLGGYSLGTKKQKVNGLTYLIEDTEEKEKLSLIRNWRIEGMKLREITQKCKELGIKTRTGKNPSLSTIKSWTNGYEPKKPIIWIKPDYSKRKGRTHVADLPQNKGLRKLVYTMRKQGVAWREIEKEVEDMGFYNSKGNKLAVSQLVRIQKNNIYRLKHDEGFKL